MLTIRPVGEFLNRTEELAFLNRALDPGRAALIVLYGRRRTGKTELLRHVVGLENEAGRDAILFVGDETSKRANLEGFGQAMASGLGDAALAGMVPSSWEAALRSVAARKRPTLVVLDEFPYLCAADPTLPSVLQRLWDAELRSSQVRLVLCGSTVSFMEREIMGAKKPLYGRRTGSWLLEPFRFKDARLFLPTWTTDAQLSAWAVFGGVPAYLQLLNPNVSLAENIKSLVLSKGLVLYDEPRFLLMQELREPRTYFAICQALANGRTTPNEIAQGAGLSDRGGVARYLETLRDLHVLDRRVPVTERNPDRTRRSVYRLSDPFFRFWFRFVLPNRSALESGHVAGTYSTRVEPWLEQHVSVGFEQACEQWLWDRNIAGRLGAQYDRVGPWWRGNVEIDLAAVSDSGAVLLGECKWSVKPVGVDILDGLIAKRSAFAADLDGEPKDLQFALFSRSGFTPELTERARRDGVLLCDLGDFE